MATLSNSRSKFSAKYLIVGCGIVLLASSFIALLAIGIFVRSLFITIEPEQVAVVISPYEPTGYLETPLTPGNHMLRPLEKVEVFKVAREVFSSSSTDCNCGSNSVTLHTKDGRDISIDYRVTYAIEPKQAVKLYQIWRHDYQVQFVVPHSKKVLSEVASKYTSDEIALSRRDEIEQAVVSRLEPDFSEAYLILLEFKISDVRYK
jgi:regulator of protease activity HflC (stomatin/prohibitin superfamily)